jgi:hypothetical protein
VKSEEIPEKRSAKSRRRSQRNRRKRRQRRPESSEKNQDCSTENSVEKQAGKRGKGINAKTKTDNEGNVTEGKKISDRKDKAGSGTKSRRRRRRNSRSSSKPRQEPKNVSEPKENPRGTRSR